MPAVPSAASTFSWNQRAVTPWSNVKTLQFILQYSQRTQAKVDKYREGYAAPGLRHAFLPAVNSTSGRIHGELLRFLFTLADKKTSRSFEALGEAFDVDSDVYCWRRSGNGVGASKLE